MPNFEEQKYHIKTEQERGEQGLIFQDAETRLHLQMEPMLGEEEQQNAVREANLARLQSKGEFFADKYKDSEYLQKKIKKYRSISRDTSRDSATETLNRQNSYKSASTRRDKYKSAAKYMDKAKAIDTQNIADRKKRYKKELKKLDHVLKAKRYIAEAKALSSQDEKQQKELAEMKIALAKYQLASNRYYIPEDAAKYKALYESHKRAYNALAARRKAQAPENLLILTKYYGKKVDTKTEAFFRKMGLVKEDWKLDEHAGLVGVSDRLPETVQDFFVHADGTYEENVQEQAKFFVKYKNAFISKKNQPDPDPDEKVSLKIDYFREYTDHIYEVIKEIAEDYGFRFREDGHLDLSEGLPADEAISREFFDRHMDKLWGVMKIGANVSTMAGLTTRLLNAYPNQYEELRDTSDRLNELFEIYSIIGSKTTAMLLDLDIDEKFCHVAQLSQGQKAGMKTQLDIMSQNARNEIEDAWFDKHATKSEKIARHYQKRHIHTSGDEFLKDMHQTRDSMKLDPETDHAGMEPRRLLETMSDFYAQPDGTYADRYILKEQVLKKFKKAFVQTKKKENAQERENRMAAKKQYIGDYTDHLYQIVEGPAKELGFRFTPDGRVDLSNGLPQDNPFPEEYVKNNMDKLANITFMAANTTTVVGLAKAYLRNHPGEFQESRETIERLDELSTLICLVDDYAGQAFGAMGIYECFTKVLEGEKLKTQEENMAAARQFLIGAKREELEGLWKEHHQA